MSMILDALSRAEKERQSENAVGLDTARYATSSTIKEDRFKKWVLIALVANFSLIVLLSLGYVWKTYIQKQPIEITNVKTPEVVTQAEVQPAAVLANTQMNTAPSLENETSEQLAPQTINLTDSVNKTLPVTSLLDETKVKQDKAIKKPVKKAVKKVVKKTPPVQYSSKPLSASTQSGNPSVASVSAAVEKQRVVESRSSQYKKLSEIPNAERSQLSQYEVNVHVYDDSGSGSFVLINMVKYKQGDHLPGGRAVVSEIVPDGVVIDYGNGRALIERNQ